jgi:hypothetical protein
MPKLLRFARFPTKFAARSRCGPPRRGRRFLDASLVRADLALAGATGDHTSVAVETVL